MEGLSVPILLGLIVVFFAVAVWAGLRRKDEIWEEESRKPRRRRWR
jgi:hypothetical protein